MTAPSSRPADRLINRWTTNEVRSRMKRLQIVRLLG